MLPILAFLLLKRNWTERVKWVCFFITLISFVADLINTYLASRHLHNLWVINIYFLIDSLLVLAFFYLVFKNYPTYRAIIGILLCLLLVSWSYNLFTNGIQNSLDSWSNGIETLSIIILSILFFYQQLVKPQSYFVYSTPVFWIVVGLLVYKSGTFFLFLYFNMLEESESLANLFIINPAFLMLRNILFTIAFFLKKESQKRKSYLQPVP